MAKITLPPKDKFAVVEFIKDDNSVSIVSTNWFIDTSIVHWPSSPNVTSMVKKHKAPEENWGRHSCKILKVKDTFEDAIIVLRLAEKSNQSTFETTVDDEESHLPRRRKRNKPKKKKKSSTSSSSPCKDSVDGSDIEVPTKSFTLPPTSKSKPDVLNYSSDSEHNQPPSVCAVGPNNSPITSGPKLVLVDPVALTSKPDESDSSRSVSNLPGYSGTAVGRNITQFEKIVLERLTKLDQLVTELLRRSGGINISIPSKIKLHKIPVETVDEFQSLNAWIKAVPENRDCLVTELSLMGANRLSGVVSKILGKVFANNLAKITTITGAGKDIEVALKDAPIYQVIRESVRLTKGYSSSTDHEIGNSVAVWLKGADDRDGGREVRRKNAHVKPNKKKTTKGGSNISSP
ncbi:hypothetical protein Fcan01_27524 [Folsomia candida]|uniref:DUF4806 domain-containing protein n=1 Tax=Folsomia candida TaxID=158441 RepID=A0A226CXN7_FOLCA|nr:hypothetical protein Fcan01_27524 [Folsomia candida]